MASPKDLKKNLIKLQEQIRRFGVIKRLILISIIRFKVIGLSFPYIQPEGENFSNFQTYLTDIQKDGIANKEITETAEYFTLLNDMLTSYLQFYGIQTEPINKNKSLSSPVLAPTKDQVIIKLNKFKKKDDFSVVEPHRFIGKLITQKSDSCLIGAVITTVGAMIAGGKIGAVVGGMIGGPWGIPIGICIGMTVGFLFAFGVSCYLALKAKKNISKLNKSAHAICKKIEENLNKTPSKFSTVPQARKKKEKKLPLETVIEETKEEISVTEKFLQPCI